eukprot:5868750-Prymnesium_polylepis.1
MDTQPTGRTLDCPGTAPKVAVVHTGAAGGQLCADRSRHSRCRIRSHCNVTVGLRRHSNCLRCTGKSSGIVWGTMMESMAVETGLADTAVRRHSQYENDCPKQLKPNHRAHDQPNTGSVYVVLSWQGTHGGRGGFGGGATTPVRGPQSVQSVPMLQSLYDAPGPPSSHAPSDA